MAEPNNEDPNKNPTNLNEANEDGEILTLADLLNEQREIDEVNFCLCGFLLLLLLNAIFYQNNYD